MTAALSGPALPPRSGGPARQVMVLLHGYGADGSDLIGLGAEWRDAWPDMLFVSPDAPWPCARNPAGREWFPLSDRPIEDFRRGGADRARPVIVDFLLDLWSQTGLDARDTVLCGFSQGAMMALHIALALARPVRGVISFSGALIAPP
jgi:phospholipase/carboxylesterase